MWRRQSEPVPVESALVTVESTPAPIESAPVPAPVESVTAPATVESTPAPVLVPALPTMIDPANPLAWLAARLAQPSETEGSGVKAVREGLAARLAVVEPSQSRSTTIEVSESAMIESSEPAVVERPESPAVEQHEAVVVEQSESPIVDQRENLTLESSELALIPRSPSPADEPRPNPESTIAESNEVTVETEAHTSTGFASLAPVPASVLVAEPEKLAETEQLVHLTEPEVQSPTPTTTDSESAVTESESDSKPEVLAAPEPESDPTEPEPTKVVQVFPDLASDVDAEVDKDLVSELADRRCTSGADEFETL